MIDNTMVEYITASTSVTAFAVSALSSMFPSMTQQAQVIRPAVMIKYGDVSPEPTAGGSDAKRLRTILFIAIPVGIVVLVLLQIGCACFKRRAQRKAAEKSPPKVVTSLWVRVA